MKWSIYLQYVVFDPFEDRGNELKLVRLSNISLVKSPCSEENIGKLGPRRQCREVSVKEYNLGTAGKNFLCPF